MQVTASLWTTAARPGDGRIGPRWHRDALVVQFLLLCCGRQPVPHNARVLAAVSGTGLVRWTGRQAVMTVPEQFDVSNAGQIRDQLLSAINRGADPLIADMSATISCDYAGSDAITRASQRAVLTGIQLRLVVTAQIVRRVLSISGLDRTVAIYPSLESATAARAPAVLTRLGGPQGASRSPPGDAQPRDDGEAIALPAIGQLLDAFQDGVALVDDHGTITLVNPRLDAMFGYRQGEVPGHPLEILLPSGLQDGPCSPPASQGHAPRTRPAAGRARLAGLRKDGTTFPAQVSFSQIPAAAGQFTLAVISDATQTRRLERLARAAVTAGQEHPGPELLDAITAALFRVGLSLQSATDRYAEPTGSCINEALGRLDEVIRMIRDAAFAGQRSSTEE